MDFNVSSDSVCHLPPSRWIPAVQEQLQQAGRLYNDSLASCEYAYQTYQSASDIQVCSNECQHCFLDPECENLAAKILYTDMEHPRCSSCYEPIHNGQSCMQLCSENIATRQDGVCVSKATESELQALTSFIAQVDYAQFLVGAFVGATALQTLFPSSFSLMFGSIKGGRVAKSIAPWSRIPGFCIGASIVLGMPMLSATMISIHQVIGDLWSLGALLGLFASILVWLPIGDLSHGVEADDNHGLIAPQPYTVAINELAVRNLWSFCLKLLSTILLVVFFAESDIGQIVKVEVENYAMQNDTSVLIRLGETILSFFLDLWGKSMLSSVVFSDACIDVLQLVTTGDLTDTMVVRANREALSKALASLTPAERTQSTTSIVPILTHRVS